MLYEVIMRGELYGQSVVNRFNYVSTGTPASILGSFGLASAMGFIPDVGVLPATGIFQRILDMQTNQMLWNAVEVRAASDYDVTDFYEVAYPAPWQGEVVSSESNSPLIAFGFRTNRVRLDIGRGFKRFAGVPEAASELGGNVTAVYLAIAVDLAEAMSDILTYDDEGNTISYSPCVVSKLEYTTPSGKPAYKYYPTLAEQLEHVALGIDWTPYATVRSQRSRQYGHGS